MTRRRWQIRAGPETSLTIGVQVTTSKRSNNSVLCKSCVRREVASPFLLDSRKAATSYIANQQKSTVTPDTNHFTTACL